MKVILLTGPSESGKTTTLLRLYDSLCSGGISNIDVPNPHPLREDEYIFYIEYNGKKIGIVTFGDYAIEIVFQIGVFLAKGADILVIANRNKGFPNNICEWHGRDNDGLLEKEEVRKISIQDKGKVQEIISKF